MANIILRANILDKNVVVEYKIIPLPLFDTKTSLIISPRSGSSIKAEDLSHGPLPREISKIEFVQLGDNVSAEVTFKSKINAKQTQNISLPIISRSKRKVDTFKLIDSTNLSGENNIVTKTMCGFPRTTNGDSVTYNVTNDLGKKRLVLSKTILTTRNHAFKQEPTYNITGNGDRYSVKTNIKRDSKSRIVEKTFNFYYTSPKEIPVAGSEDVIYFDAKAISTVKKPRVKVATKPEEYKIYSFNSGSDVGQYGGVKTIRVQGIPGSKFKVIVQDADKKTYNFKTGKFENGGGMLEGIIPLPRGKRSYGEYIAYVEVPASATASTITTRLATDKPIEHDKLVELSKKDASTALARTGVTLEKGIVEDVASSIEFALFSSGFTIPGTGSTSAKILATSNLIIGPGKAGSLGKDGSFEVDVHAATAQVIRIERQPLFSQGSYVNWDSGSDKARALTSAGVSIPSDWYVADAKSATYSVKASVTGIGRAHGTYTDGYKTVRISGKISKIIHGKGDIEVSLDLLNFLTLQSI